MDKKPFWQKKPVEGILLALSTACALGLFWSPSTIVTLMLAAIFGLTGFQFLLRLKEETCLTLRPGAVFSAAVFALIGVLIMQSELGCSPLLPLLLAVSGLYAFYRLAFWLEETLCEFFGFSLSVKFRPFHLVFPLSALGFFSLEARWDPYLISAAMAAAVIALIISLHSPDLLIWSQKQSKHLRLLALLNGLGILIFRIREADRGIFGLAAGILALPFLYLCLLALYAWLSRIFREQGTFRDIGKKEWGLYMGLFLVTALVTAAIFCSTDAFYGTAHEFDVIYTSDSPTLLSGNVYLSLHNPENDLRQPLFAVFAAPFQGLPYLVSLVFSGNPAITALIWDLPQIGLILLSVLLLAKMLGLDRRKRMLFMGLCFFSYPTLLFFLMMEQYPAACFWLILCFYLLNLRSKEARLPLFGAGGTLLTSIILLPCLGTARQFRQWFSQMLRLAGGFLLFLLGFGRLDIILDAPTRLLMMVQFSGKAVTFREKLLQYSAFFRQCAAAPAAGADLSTMGYPSWQLTVPEGLSLLGLLILGLCILSLVLNRKDRPSLLAALWLGFSLAVLVLLGWGTQENGLILYSLYFGWAVWVLLFRLLQKLDTRIPHLLDIGGWGLLIALAAWNLPAMGKLIAFALAYYPI